ncbi:AMP-binding protein [Pedobacter petrophilus]|uniref:AMP-binding protein n=2 Tax=Pedobacter petrophilus TaxID=1908241 RepID=A0A7K0G5V8_9SPHI|nr:AMP-binding protein [Pedobacter petrophilus]
MPHLYDLILNNDALRYIDSSTGIFHTAKDFHESLAIDQTSGLVFLYLDNGLKSIEILLNFLRTDFSIALLSPALNGDYKTNLENHYRPYYIYDPLRVESSDYISFDAGPAHQLFKRKDRVKTEVNRQIKLLINTSGSTGSPKFVKLSEQNIVSNALSIVDYLPVNYADVTPLNLPLFYSYGFSVFTTNSIAGGAIVCTNKTIIEKEFWEEFDQFRYTSLAGVPYVYEMLQRIGFLAKTYPSLRYLTQAGGRMNESILAAFGQYTAENEISFFSMYGQTEATARISYLPPEFLLDKLGSVGKPIKNGRLDIDPDSGELRYYGPNIFGGYATKAEDLLTYQKEDMLLTGDLARADEDGFFYITGRSKRFIKLFGVRINLDEIEQILTEKFNNVRFICIGEEDKHMLVAYTGNKIDEKSVKQLLFEQVKIHPACVKTQLLDSIPLTPNGKVDYMAIKDGILV